LRGLASCVVVLGAALAFAQAPPAASSATAAADTAAANTATTAPAPNNATDTTARGTTSTADSGQAAAGNWIPKVYALIGIITAVLTGAVAGGSSVVFAFLRSEKGRTKLMKLIHEELRSNPAALMEILDGEFKKKPSQVMELIEGEVRKKPNALMTIIYEKLDCDEGRAAIAKHFLAHMRLTTDKKPFADLLVGFLGSEDAAPAMKAIVARYAFEAIPARDESKKIADEVVKNLAAAMSLSAKDRMQSERLVKATDIAQKEAKDPAINIPVTEDTYVELSEYLRKKE
jgi:hypothetical protein